MTVTVPELRDQPWSFDVARQVCRAASERQADAEQLTVQAARDAAEAEAEYRQALARKIVELHDAGAAWTVATDLAKGDPEVARLKQERDVAEGVKAAADQAAWRCTADRKDAQRFADWSQRRELSEGGER